MSSQKETAAGSSKAGPAVMVVAVLIPLVPLVWWLQSLIQMMPGPVQSVTLGLYMLARSFALVGFVLMFYQFILSARIPFLEAIFKRFTLIKTHRILGKVGFILMLLHGVILLSLDPSLYIEKTLGLIALVLLTFAVIAAWFFKPLKLKTGTWKTIHLAAYLVFPLVFIHALALGGTINSAVPVYWLFVVMFAGYCLIVVYRLARLVAGKKPAGRSGS